MHDISSCGVKYRMLGEMLFLQIVFCFIAVYLCFISGCRLYSYAFPVAIFVSFLYVFIASGKDSRALQLLMYSLLSWTVVIPASSLLIDGSYDGNAYHQEIIAALCRGWNLTGNTLEGYPLSVWSLHYAKGMEMAQSALVSFTGFIESGKSVNFILALSVYFILLGFLESRFKGMPRSRRISIALIATCNPVFLSQCLTYYIDFAKYFFTLLTIIYVMDCCSTSGKGDWTGWFFLFSVITMAAVTKFNAFFEEGVIIFASMLWLAYASRWNKVLKIALCGVAAAIAGGVILGYHPYITNLLYAGHPLYPLMGEGCVDIMTGNTPPELLNNDRFTNFLISLSTPALPSTDRRMGGFTILMIPMLMLALTGILLTTRKLRNLSVYISLWTVASCFFFEQSWWARYIPQLWLIVALGAACLAVNTRYGKFNRFSFILLCICTVISSMLCMAMTIKESLRETAYRAVIAGEFKGRGIYVEGMNEAYLRQLSERGVYLLPNPPENADPAFTIPYFGSLSKSDSYPIIITDSISKSEILGQFEKMPFNFSQKLNPEYTDE